MLNQILKQNLKRILYNHDSRANPISRRELKALLELPENKDRELRLVISELRQDGIPVLFATNKPAGYYLPLNNKELQEGINQLRSYIIDECRVLRAFKVKGNQYLNGMIQRRLL